MGSYGIHWFRRDLRLAGNEAFQHNWKKHQGRVLGFFCFDHKFLSRPDFSADRFQFFLSTLEQLQKEMQKVGGDLLLLDIGPEKAYEQLFHYLQQKNKPLPTTISWNRDYEPFARKRDKKIQSVFSKLGIEIITQRDHLLIEPEELTKDDGSAYQVYSPFARKWNQLFSDGLLDKRLMVQKKGIQYLKKLRTNTAEPFLQLKWTDLIGKQNPFGRLLNQYLDKNKKLVSVVIPPAGCLAALTALEDFKKKIANYSNARDVPSEQATSRLSMYFKNGSLTIAQVIAYLDLHPYKKASSSADKFLSELIWREFYYHILYWYPNVEQEAFLAKYRDLKWQNDRKYFDAWKNGLTGFPIVDAGMRELLTTGWMHNRVRMIVASFLTKDLLIDWQWGERYFMEKLLDGDLAPNNGGWQWAASTGCDPQPYFRIFNPWLQSKKFDPKGEYIKQFVPELKDVAAKDLHKPIEDHKSYPRPLVQHDVQRALALKLYKV